MLPLGILWTLTSPGKLAAVDWPWNKPHELTAECRLDRQQVERGAPDLLRAMVEAKDPRGHALAYSWSSNGGIVRGSGAQVDVDASQLPPGVYSVLAAVQDAQKNRATCTASFEVLAPSRRDMVTLTCASEPAVVQPGTAVQLKAAATSKQSQRIYYQWFANAGTIEGNGPEVRLDTARLLPGIYSVSSRAEDGWGGVSDCITTVTVELPPVPPEPVPSPEPANVLQILFGRNQQDLEPDQQATLEPVVERLQKEPAGRVSIESYAAPDEREPAQLAAARAEAVKRYLLEKGVPETRLRVVVGEGGWRGGLRNRTLDIIWLPDGLEF